MLRQLLARFGAAVWPVLRQLGRMAAEAMVRLWQVIRAPLLGILNVLAALILIFEEWGWKPLSDLLGYLARLKPWARVEQWIAGLPPYGALLVFALPSTILLPVKLAGLWLLANGQALVAGVMLIGAKIVSTALVARIFMLTRPALMRIGWFAAAYNTFMPWKEALFARIRASWAWRYGRMLKTAIRHEARQVWSRWRPAVIAFRHAITRRARTALATVRSAARRRWRALRDSLGF